MKIIGSITTLLAGLSNLSGIFPIELNWLNPFAAAAKFGPPQMSVPAFQHLGLFCRRQKREKMSLRSLFSLGIKEKSNKVGTRIWIGQAGNRVSLSKV